MVRVPRATLPILVAICALGFAWHGTADSLRVTFTGLISPNPVNLYSGDPETGRVELLVKDVGDQTIASWSPPHRAILYASHGEIYRLKFDADMEPDGEPVNLTQHEAWDRFPSWTPDGRHIVFGSRRDGLIGLFRMDADGGNVERLLDDGTAFFASVSPNGSSIAYYSLWQLHVMDIDGTGSRYLADATTFNWGMGHPSWSSTEDAIAFTSPHDTRMPSPTVYDMRTGRLERLMPDVCFSGDPAFAPDGRTLAFATYYDRAEKTPLGIYAMDRDGGDPTLLFEPPPGVTFVSSTSWIGYDPLAVKPKNMAMSVWGWLKILK
ncbi:MAG: hypothetical protein O3A46_07955 [Candidatus Poribacteria bacterium]|nr:hypothetical protein [Candidatus Poribacteria bacterium]